MHNGVLYGPGHLSYVLQQTSEDFIFSPPEDFGEFGRLYGFVGAKPLPML